MATTFAAGRIAKRRTYVSYQLDYLAAGRLQCMNEIRSVSDDAPFYFRVPSLLPARLF